MSDPLNLLQDPEFRRMARTKDTISIVLTAATLVIYFGFILLIAFIDELVLEIQGRRIRATSDEALRNE